MKLFPRVVICLMTLVTLPVLGAPPSYTVMDLGSYLIPYHINSSGQVVGQTKAIPGAGKDPATYPEGFFYDRNLVPNLVIGGYFGAGFYGINSAGKIVGQDRLYIFEHDGFPEWHGVLYEPGFTQLPLDLGTLGGIWSSANAINDRNQVVGWSDLSGDLRAFIYDYNSGGPMQPLPLPVPGGPSSWATDINYDGKVVGYSGLYGNPGNDRAFLYSGGTADNLPTLAGGSRNRAYAINASGAVVGVSATASTPNETCHAFLYKEDGKLIDIGPLFGDQESSAYAINSYGEVVGTSGTAGGACIGNASVLTGDTVGRAFIYHYPGPPQDLNPLMATNDWSLLAATGINDFGQIIGVGVPHGQTGPIHALLLTPDPVTAGSPMITFFAALNNKPPGKTLLMIDADNFTPYGPVTFLVRKGAPTYENVWQKQVSAWNGVFSLDIPIPQLECNTRLILMARDDTKGQSTAAISIVCGRSPPGP